MSKFLYPIYKLNIESYKKWWLYHKKAGGSGILSKILEGFSFNLENTLNRKFKLFEIEGNSVQDGTPSPNNEVPILSSGDNGSINEKISNKNLLPNNATTQTYFGITITKKDDGTLILNGTATDIIQLNLLNNKRNNTMLPEADIKNSLKSGIYKLSGCTNGSSSTYKLDVWVEGAGGLTATCYNQEVQFTLDEEKIVSYLRLVVYSGATLNNVVIKPMVRLASVTDNSYVPHEEQDYSIFAQQPMRSIGDVRDKFVKVNGNWFERHLPYIASYNGETLPQDVYNEVEGIKYCNDKSMSTTGQFSNGASVQYVDENNWNYLPCTPDQIQQLENLPSTYKDFTIIQSQDETPAHLKIQYYKEG